MKNTRSLRFAPLIRVSTEKQEKKGESLNTQKKQILHYVNVLGGTIPESCWKYSGQEHATPGQERKKLDRLLEDSKKGIFDAVIVCDASRWSRDNEKSKAGLKTLKKNGIKFFVGTTEFDLFIPEHIFFLGMATEMNELQANQQSLKSILNRIEKAKKGIPTGGKLPYGRTYDRESGTWGIDAEKARTIKQIAKEYLEYGRGEKIAQKYSMNWPNLLKILKHRCSDKWTIHFQLPEFNIDETVSLTIPRLLPEETVKAIHRRTQANKTYTHGFTKYRYLLSRMIFCEVCGFAIFGQVNHSKKKYYRHPRQRGCDNFHSIPADDIENAVLIHLFRMFGNRTGMESAIKDAIPDEQELKHLKSVRQSLNKEFTKTKGEITRLVEAIAKGIITEDESRHVIEKIREKQQTLRSELTTIDSKIEKLPSKELIGRAAELMKAHITEYYSASCSFTDMSFDEKRKLMQYAFGGMDQDGKRCGVYVKKESDGWSYVIRGIFWKDRDWLPMELWKAQFLLGIEDEYINPFLDKQDMLRERHAHHGLRIHQRR